MNTRTHICIYIYQMYIQNHLHISLCVYLSIDQCIYIYREREREIGYMQANFICTHIFAYILYRYSRYYPFLNYAYIHNPHIIHILSIFSSMYYLYRLSIDYPHMCIYILYDIIFYYYYYIILCLLLYYIYMSYIIYRLSVD